MKNSAKSFSTITEQIKLVKNWMKLCKILHTKKSSPFKCLVGQNDWKILFSRLERDQPAAEFEMNHPLMCDDCENGWRWNYERDVC